MKRVIEKQFLIHPKDAVLEPILLEDVINAVYHNRKVRDERAVMNEFNDMVDRALDDAQYILEQNMEMILREANPEE